MPSVLHWQSARDDPIQMDVAIFSFHLARASVPTTLAMLWRPPRSSTLPGLLHAENMTRMTLGAPIASPGRMQLRHVAMFAAWEDEAAIEGFLANTRWGRALSHAWHVRLQLVRQWRRLRELEGMCETVGKLQDDEPVVAVTVARMKLPQVPRFIRWGRPVEELVRDHPGATLAMAAMRLPRTVSTFTVWRSQRDMLDMVQGHSVIARPERHAQAMVERNRKDFHFEFTTLRFRPLSEHGQWEGRTGIVPIGARG